MSRRRQHRRADKARRHDQLPSNDVRVLTVVREAAYVERLAYTRSQAARALGLSGSTFARRVLPYVETLQMPWGATLVPVDEIERLVAQHRRQAAKAQRAPAPTGRPRAVPIDIVVRIRRARDEGMSFRAIADELTSDAVPTVHGGVRWWPSTVRAILERRESSRRPRCTLKGMTGEHDYEVVLDPQPEGGFVVYVPDLPDVVTEGETREEALAMAKDAIEGYLETMRERGWPVRRALREHVAVRTA